MADKMLIDAAHPEETRVVVVKGNRVEEFDFESEHKKQIKGNIYLAKVTRVEPSLQAAFVEYGGNRHGDEPHEHTGPEDAELVVGTASEPHRTVAEDEGGVAAHDRPVGRGRSRPDEVARRRQDGRQEADRPQAPAELGTADECVEQEEHAAHEHDHGRDERDRELIDHASPPEPGRRAGNATVKVDPTPSTLSTVMSPP